MVLFCCPHLHLVTIVKSKLLPSSPQSLQLSDLIVLFIQLPKQKHSVKEQPILSKTQPRIAKKNLTRAHTRCLKLLTVKHALHVPTCASKSSHTLYAPVTELPCASMRFTRLTLSAFVHVSPTLTSSCTCQHLASSAYVSTHQQLTLPLTVDF